MTAAATRSMNPERLRRAALRVGAAALTASALIGLADPGRFFEGYLIAYVLWLGAALGGAALLMIHHLTGGRWGWSVRRGLEGAALSVPLLALLFLPLLFGAPRLYPWVERGVDADDALVAFRAAYFSLPFFVARALIYLAAWSALGGLLYVWSSRIRPGAASPPRLRRLAAGGLVGYGLTASFAMVDWVASLEPSWHSSIYGLYVVAGQLLTALAVLIVVRIALVPRLGGGDPPDAGVLHDLGNLLLALSMVYCYLAFSQFLIMWSGNLPKEIAWYVHRTRGGWSVAGGAIMVVSFAVPLAALLLRRVKRHPGPLLAVAAVVLASRVLDVTWMVAPSFDAATILTAAVAIVAAIGIGGVWLGFFLKPWDGAAPAPAEAVP